LIMPIIPLVEGDMLGKILKLRYVEHDLADKNKFHEIFPLNYLCTIPNSDATTYAIKSKQWAQGMEKVGILNLLDIPHFCRSTEINYYVKLLFSFVHGGNLWLEKKIP